MWRKGKVPEAENRLVVSSDWDEDGEIRVDGLGLID
jgi:hypothetical protein